MPAAMRLFASSATCGSPSHCGHGLMSTTTNTGTRQMRASVTMLAGVHSLSVEAGLAWSVGAMGLDHAPSIS